MKLSKKIIKDKKGFTKAESSLIHKIHSDKATKDYVKLEADYSKLHYLYNKEHNPVRKKKLLKQLESAHKVVVKHRKRMFKNPEHHALLHKLHGTKTKAELHKKIHKEHLIDKTEHTIIDTTKEVEQRKTLKHIVPPVKSHVFQDLGRGLKSVAVGVGEVAGAGAYKLGTALTNLAGKIMGDKGSGDTPNIDFSEDIRG